MVMRFLAFGLVALLAGCAGGADPMAFASFKEAKKPELPKPSVEMVFQGGQRVTVQLLGENEAVQRAFLQWVSQGVYTQAPVYRQLPGVFILAGKPRLAGEGFVNGVVVPPKMTPKGELEDTKLPEAGVGHLGLVVHADGTVGPEMILVYGRSLRNCCEAPQSVRIGAIRTGQMQVESIMRGDNLLGVAKAP